MSDEREELAAIAASLKAHLELSFDAGTTGIPRGARRGIAPKSQAAPSSSVSSSAPSAHAASAASATAPSAPGSSSGTSETVEALREHERASRESTPPETRPAPPPVSLAPETVPVPVSESAVATVRSLPMLEEQVAACTRCELAKTRTKTVFSRGNPKAALCFIGEAPGADEDAQGIPFVGKAGQLLDKMIAAMGLDADKDVYVCNIIKCRPPGNRRPTAEETATCIPYLHDQLANVHPKVIVAMGNTSVQTLLDTKLGITRLRGQWKLYRGKTLLMPTYHPSYLLRESPIQKLAKQEAWEDLQKVMKELGLPLPAKGTNPPGYRPPPASPSPDSSAGTSPPSASGSPPASPSTAFPPSAKDPKPAT